MAALQCAAMAVSTGVATHVLIPLGRDGYSGSRIGSRIGQMPQFKIAAEFEAPVGANAPAQYYAPMARRHMELYGTTREQFAEVAVTMRRHAMLNDNALMQHPMTVEDHHASRMIADPFRLFDCCLESDGGAAVVVSAAGVRMVAPLVENDASRLTLGLGVELDYNDVSTTLTLPRFRVHE